MLELLLGAWVAAAYVGYFCGEISLGGKKGRRCESAKKLFSGVWLLVLRCARKFRESREFV